MELIKADWPIVLQHSFYHKVLQYKRQRIKFVCLSDESLLTWLVVTLLITITIH